VAREKVFSAGNERNVISFLGNIEFYQIVIGAVLVVVIPGKARLRRAVFSSNYLIGRGKNAGKLRMSFIDPFKYLWQIWLLHQCPDILRRTFDNSIHW